MASKEHKNGYWTKERCAIEALKYNRSSDFREGNQAAYSKVRKSGWWSELCSHFDKKHFWTIYIFRSIPVHFPAAYKA